MPHLSDLPHRHPFRFVFGEVEEDRIEVLLTPAGPWARGGAFPQFFALEILGQATALLMASRAPAEAEALRQPGYLAGVTDLVLHRQIGTEERFQVRAELERAFGALVKVRASLSSGTTLVAEAQLLLAVGGIG